MKNALLSYFLTVFIAIVAVTCLVTALSPAAGAINDAFSVVINLFAQLG
jgi:hypothetical protein